MRSPQQAWALPQGAASVPPALCPAAREGSLVLRRQMRRQPQRRLLCEPSAVVASQPTSPAPPRAARLSPSSWPAEPCARDVLLLLCCSRRLPVRGVGGFPGHTGAVGVEGQSRLCGFNQTGGLCLLVALLIDVHAA